MCSHKRGNFLLPLSVNSRVVTRKLNINFLMQNLVRNKFCLKHFVINVMNFNLKKKKNNFGSLTPYYKTQYLDFFFLRFGDSMRTSSSQFQLIINIFFQFTFLALICLYYTLDNRVSQEIWIQNSKTQWGRRKK